MVFVLSVTTHNRLIKERYQWIQRNIETIWQIPTESAQHMCDIAIHNFN